MLRFLRRVNRAMGVPSVESYGDEPRETVALERATNITPASASPRIIVKSEREDAPEWKRKYKATFAGGYRIEITMRSMFSWHRSSSAFIYQPNGKMMIFDAENVADKIIDRALVPVVEAVVSEMLAIDDDFMASERNQFTDVKGQTWQRIA